MPIIKIRAQLPTDELTIREMLSSIRSLGAKALACTEDNIWVFAVPLLSGFNSLPDQTAVVTIKANEGRNPGQVTDFVNRLAEFLASVLKISANDIWIHYCEMNPKDIWYRGRWSAHKEKK